MTKTIQKTDSYATPMKLSTYDDIAAKVKLPYLSKIRRSCLRRDVLNRLANRTRRHCPGFGYGTAWHLDATRDHSSSENRLAALALAAVASRYPLGPNFDSQSSTSTSPLHYSEPSSAQGAKPSHLVHRHQFVALWTAQSQLPDVNKDHIASSLVIDTEDYSEVTFNQLGGLGRAYELFGDSLTSILEELNARLAT